ncbi:MAG: formimidoylglutamase [Aggregatilineales bacterium]
MTSLDVFAYTSHPDETLFYQRNDANDPRMGEIVHSNRAAYERSRTIILGCPQDEGVKRRGSRLGSSGAPDEIRSWFYQLSVSNLTDDPNFNLFDLGNLHIRATLEETHAAQRELVHQLLKDGKTVITLGGGGDVAYPDGMALKEVADDIMLLSVDSHFDVREERLVSCGTANRNLIAEGAVKAENFYALAYQVVANSPVYAKYLRGLGAHLHSLNDLREAGLLDTVRQILVDKQAGSLMWTFDLDSVRASDAPGVNAPMPLGLTGEEFCKLAEIAGNDARTRVVQFVEVNSKYDLAGRTSHLTAVAMFHFLSGMNKR